MRIDIDIVEPRWQAIVEKLLKNEQIINLISQLEKTETIKRVTLTSWEQGTRKDRWAHTTQIRKRRTKTGRWSKTSWIILIYNFEPEFETLEETILHELEHLHLDQQHYEKIQTPFIETEIERRLRTDHGYTDRKSLLDSYWDATLLGEIGLATAIELDQIGPKTLRTRLHAIGTKPTCRWFAAWELYHESNWFKEGCVERGFREIEQANRDYLLWETFVT